MQKHTQHETETSKTNTQMKQRERRTTTYRKMGTCLLILFHFALP